MAAIARQRYPRHMTLEQGSFPEVIADKLAVYDASGSAIAELAREAFPRIEPIWREPSSVSPTLYGISGPWLEITRRILRCRVTPLAAAAMRADAVLGPAIASRQLYVGLAGSGSALQAEVLPEALVRCACIQMAARGLELTEDHLVEMAVGNLHRLRNGITGDLFDGWMLTAFRGIRLSPALGVSTPWGQLVHADGMSSDIWAPNGCSAVLATPIRSCLRPKNGPPFSLGSQTESLRLETNRIAQLVSYGCALGSVADDPTTAIPISSGELLPTGMNGHGGEIRMVGHHLRSSPISPEEADQIALWMACLNGAPLERIDVALRRLVRGLAERLDYLDSLIDAVIAWENLVESRDQPTKSVLYGISALVGNSTWSKTRIKRVYEARSSLIHGEVPNYANSKGFAGDALRIGLDALRSVFDSHADKLEMSSEERVASLGFVADGKSDRC